MHSDVGGGYLDSESGLAKIALEWMIVEAAKAQLIVAPDRVTEVLVQPEAPNANGKMHNSLTDGAWIALEVLPHRYVDMSAQPPKTRWRLPLARRRRIPENATIHESVFVRSGYHPANLPVDHTVEPWIHWTAAAPSARAAQPES